MLGMPAGTAFARLRKILLFDLACRLEVATCFHCGHEIRSVSEFSIEHKEPWEGPDATRLFFDISNIAFSHLACNSAAARKPYKIYASRKEKDAAYDHRRRVVGANSEKYKAVRRLKRRKVALLAGIEPA
jgi:hypothetical protein